MKWLISSRTVRKGFLGTVVITVLKEGKRTVDGRNCLQQFVIFRKHQVFRRMWT